MSAADQKSFGLKLKTYRSERSLSLDNLERKTGISKGYLSQLERGAKSNPGIDVVKKLARGLGVHIGDLVEEEQIYPTVQKIPRELCTFLEKEKAAGRSVPKNDVAMLLGIRYQGRWPGSTDDWDYLYSSIKRSIKTK